MFDSIRIYQKRSFCEASLFWIFRVNNFLFLTAITCDSLRRVNVAATENTTIHQRFCVPIYLTLTATFLHVLRQPKNKQFFCSVSNDLILKKELFFTRHDCGARSNSFCQCRWYPITRQEWRKNTCSFSSSCGACCDIATLSCSYFCYLE